MSEKRNTSKEKRKRNKGYPYKKLNRKKENEKAETNKTGD